MTAAEEILLKAESDQERLAAVLRLVVFLAFLVVVLSLRQQGDHHHPILGVTLTYGLLALIGLFLALRGLLHPLLPYLIVTLEVGFLVVQITLMASLMGLPLSMLASVPMASIIFVFLAHAAMRYRPWLVVYTAVMFLAGLCLVVAVSSSSYVGVPDKTAGEHNIVHYQVIPFAVLLLTVLILFVSGRGTRKLLYTAVEERVGRARLARFFAPDIVEKLFSSDETEIGTGQVQDVVVLFADIRGFSTLAENMDPSELSKLLAEIRDILATTIRAHGGVVDKFIGDAVLAVFGFPKWDHSPPDRALQCALALRKGVAEWSSKREIAGYTPVEIGIGCHAGSAFVGVIGQESLLEFTVIGDTVNIAERVERLTRTLDADIVLTASMAKSLTVSPKAPWSFSADCRLMGRSQSIDVFFLPRSV